MTVIGILFEKRIVDDSGFPRTPDRPVELLGTRVRYLKSVKTTIGACGPNSLGGSATIGSRPVTSAELVSSRSCVRLGFHLRAWTLLDILSLLLCF